MKMSGVGLDGRNMHSLYIASALCSPQKARGGAEITVLGYGLATVMTRRQDD